MKTLLDKKRSIVGGGLRAFWPALTYKIRDLFLTDRAVGEIHGTAAEPGPGVRYVVDTGSDMTIAGDVLTMTPGSFGNPGLYYDLQSRVCGLAVVTRINKAFSGYFQAGFDNDRSSVINTGWYVGAGAVMYFYDGAVVTASLGGVDYPMGYISAGVDYDFAVVLRDTGVLLLAKAATDTQWRLMWVGTASNAASLYPCLINNDTTLNAKRFEAFNAPGGYAAQYGIATSRVASPASGETATMTADAIVEFTWTPAAAETLEVQFRRVDDNNCWLLRCDQAAGTLKLYEKSAGVETERDAGKTQTWSVGTAYRIVIITDTATIRTFVANVLKHGYTTATFQQTATGVMVGGFATGSNLVCYPRLAPPLPFDRAIREFMAYGDSKSLGGYQPGLLADLNDEHAETWTYETCALGGATVASKLATIETDLGAVVRTPEIALLNLGANDVNSLPSEAQWTADYLATLDAIHARWPACQCYIMRPWRRGYASQCNSLATWIAAIVAARSSFAHLGPDERVFLENGDDGATYTTDGTHPNAAGYALTAVQWRSVIGV